MAAFEGECTFIGTATVLLRLGSFTILTDPNLLHAGSTATSVWGCRATRVAGIMLTMDGRHGGVDDRRT